MSRAEDPERWARGWPGVRREAGWIVWFEQEASRQNRLAGRRCEVAEWGEPKFPLTLAYREFVTNFGDLDAELPCTVAADRQS